MGFRNAYSYLKDLDMQMADPLDRTSYKILMDAQSYERASQALRRRFVRGATFVEGIDRGGRLTRIKRDRKGGTYIYLIEGADGNWTTPEERIWVVAMYALWQSKNTTHV